MYLDQGLLGSWFSPPHHQCTRHCDTGHSCPYGFQLNKQTNKQKEDITKWTNNKLNNSCKTENVYCPNYSLWYEVMMITKLAQEKNAMSIWGVCKNYCLHLQKTSLQSGLYTFINYSVISFHNNGNIFKISSIVIHCESIHCLLSWSLWQLSCSFIFGWWGGVGWGGGVGRGRCPVLQTHM